MELTINIRYNGRKLVDWIFSKLFKLQSNFLKRETVFVSSYLKIYFYHFA